MDGHCIFIMEEPKERELDIKLSRIRDEFRFPTITGKESVSRLPFPEVILSNVFQIKEKCKKYSGPQKITISNPIGPKDETSDKVFAQ